MIDNKFSSVKKIINSPYFIICLVYFICHWAMLFLSGSFWDDLCWETHDYNKFKGIALMTGRPDWLVLIPFAWSLPHNSYRVLVFLMYAFQSIMFYKILIKLQIFDKKEALMFSLVYLSVPVNDARVLLSCFSYTVGLTFFFIAIYFWGCLEKSVSKGNCIYFIRRIGILFLFCLSFVLNSLIFFYYVLFFFIFMNYFIKYEDLSFCKRIVICAKKTVFKYFDFLIIPFVFFTIKSIFFPVYGVYESYNIITVESLFVAALKSVFNVPITLKLIFNNYTHFISSYTRIILLLLLVSLVYNNISSDGNQKKSKYYYIKFILLSFVVLFMGIFPYMAIGRINITTTGVGGRDSILTSFGLALFVYSIAGLQSSKCKRITCFLCIVFGCIHFNWWYFEYQKDYYSQLAFENKIDNPYIYNHQNFLVINESKTAIAGERFYSLSHNARHVFSNQRHFFLSGIDDLQYLNSDWLKKRAKFGMLGGNEDVDTNYIQLDGVIFYKHDISLKKTLKLKFLEVLFENKFNHEIKKQGAIKLIPLSSIQSEEIIKEYNNGELSKINLFRLLDYNESKD